MVFHDLNVIRMDITPYEPDSKLVIHSNAVLTSTFAAKCFEAITWWNLQFVQPDDSMEDAKLLQRGHPDACGQSPALTGIPQETSVRVLEVLDQGSILTKSVHNVYRYAIPTSGRSGR
jgi:hypothetical protein